MRQECRDTGDPSRLKRRAINKAGEHTTTNIVLKTHIVIERVPGFWVNISGNVIIHLNTRRPDIMVIENTNPVILVSHSPDLSCAIKKEISRLFCAIINRSPCETHIRLTVDWIL